MSSKTDIKVLLQSRRKTSNDTTLLVILSIAFVAASIFIPNFFSLSNVFNLIVQTSTTGLLVLGLTFVLITGGIDLSMASAMAACATVGASFIVKGMNPILGCIIMLIVGLIIGAINGLAVSKLRMIPMIVTLASSVVCSGFAVWWTGARSVYGLPQIYIDFIAGNIGPIPIPVIIIAIFSIIAYILLSKTQFGRQVYAVGINSKTAQISGVPVKKVLFSTYALSGLFAGFCAILLTAKLTSASASMGGDVLMMDVISAAVIGGVSIYGGVGTITGAIMGAFIITMISNSMNLLGLTYTVTLIIKGAVLILATVRDSSRAR